MTRFPLRQLARSALLMAGTLCAQGLAAQAPRAPMLTPGDDEPAGEMGTGRKKKKYYN